MHRLDVKTRVVRPSHVILADLNTNCSSVAVASILSFLMLYDFSIYTQKYTKLNSLSVNQTFLSFRKWCVSASLFILQRLYGLKGFEMCLRRQTRQSIIDREHGLRGFRSQLFPFFPRISLFSQKLSTSRSARQIYSRWALKFIFCLVHYRYKLIPKWTYFSTVLFWHWQITY